ncbi:MAG: hypothetical protein ACYC6O_08415 [Thermoleophilia bacterium]
MWLPESAYAGSDIFDPVPAPIAAGLPNAESVVLDPEDISNFTLVGTQAPDTGPELLFSDAMNTDVSGLYALAPWAAIGTTVDIIATFQVTSQASHGVDAGFQLVINDGANNRAAIMSAILINNLPHIGLVGAGPRDQLATYPAFVQAEWQAAPLTVHLRRWADGSFEVLELNGAPPSQPVFLPAWRLPPGTRAFGSIDFGSFSPLAIVNANVSEFRAFTVPDLPCTPVRPELSLSMANVYWASYQDYILRELSVDYLIANNGPNGANGVRVVGTINSAGVNSINTPLVVGGIAVGSSVSATIKYDAPIGVGSFRSTVYATSEDFCGGSNSYPGPYGS